MCGLRPDTTGPREYTIVVHFLTHIGTKINHKISAKFTFTSILELDGLIRKHRAASKDGIVLFMLSKKSVRYDYDYQWMELTDLAHPSELPKDLEIHIADPKG